MAMPKRPPVPRHLSSKTEPICSMAGVLQCLLASHVLVIDDYGYTVEAGVLSPRAGDMSWIPVGVDVAEELIERGYVRLVSRVGGEERFEITSSGRRAIVRWGTISRAGVTTEVIR